MNPREDPNIVILENSSAPEIERMLVSGFISIRDNPFSPLYFVSDDPEITTQISRLFPKLSHDGQKTFRKALSNLISTWHPHTLSMETISQSAIALSELVLLASRINLFETAPYLIGIVNKGLLDRLSPTDFEIVCYRILGALISFAEYDTHTNLHFFERALFATNDTSNNGIDNRYSPQLFIGCCKCDPYHWPMYLLRFLKIVENYPNTFPLEHTFAKFAEIIGLFGFAKRLKELSSSDLTLVFDYLCKNKWSPFELYYSGYATTDVKTDLKDDSSLENPLLRLRRFKRESVQTMSKVIYLIHNRKLQLGYEKSKRYIIYDANDKTTTNTNIFQAVFPKSTDTFSSSQPTFNSIVSFLENVDKHEYDEPDLLH